MSFGVPTRFSARYRLFPRRLNLTALINPHSEVYEVEPICRMLLIAQSTHF